jgi:hypothetical protein
MRLLLLGFLTFIVNTGIKAQLNCRSHQYQLQQLSEDPALFTRITAVENQIQQSHDVFSRDMQGVIKIPVVIHILYHFPSQKISDAQVNSQIAALNRDFRRRAADTTMTPAYFKSLAADCEFEFYLARSDPGKRSTTGVIRKYSPVVEWNMDDKMKFSAEMGDDAWDPGSYLNIWICDLKGLAGYSSVLGGPENKDGLVIDFDAFGTINTTPGYNMGKTVVHEVGHWLGLKHLWGDADCGDDGVNDTPKQSFYTVGCPSGIRLTCNNGPFGNMYMNYMDFTQDACMNLFTLGQKERMRSLFATDGIRNSLLYSKGLDDPLIFETPLPVADPAWLHPKLFPIPATNELTLDLSYDVRWLGKTISITNIIGQSVMKQLITNKIQKINISRLNPGIYFLNSKKEDGEAIKEKFIKL